MILEIMNEEDISKVKNSVIEEYLHKRFEEIEQPVDFRVEGYFLYLKDVDLLDNPQQLTFGTLPSLEQGLLSRAENITIVDNVVEISILINNEFMFSLIILKQEIDDSLLERMKL